MTQTTTTTSPLLRDAALLTDGPAWLQTLRTRGRDHFAAVGLPTTNDEEWQLTNVAPLAGLGLKAPAARGEASRDSLAQWAIPDLDCHTLVFVDGFYAPELSDIGEFPQGVDVTPLGQAAEANSDWVADQLGRYASPESEAFVALNSAYVADGACIRVPDGVSLDRPIHLLFVSSESATPAMTSPRVLIVAGNDAKCEVIEQHAGTGGVYFSNAVTEIAVGDRANVGHVFLERDSREAYNVSTLQIHQGEDSYFASHTLLLGGKLVRNNVNPVLGGPNCLSLLNGLYLPDDGRHMDNHMYVHHRQPDCESRQYYAGILQGASTGVFIGRIKVDQVAQKTDAVQSSRSLLLSDNAHAHNRPQLEIFADDVKCTHGSTIGELDEKAMLYLRSRGISEDAAKALLVYAFANESIERIENEPLRKELAKLMVRELALDEATAAIID